MKPGCPVPQSRTATPFSGVNVVLGSSVRVSHVDVRKARAGTGMGGVFCMRRVVAANVTPIELRATIPRMAMILTGNNFLSARRSGI